jgi:FtsZ-interacting cell division protein ZipA
VTGHYTIDDIKKVSTLVKAIAVMILIVVGWKLRPAHDSKQKMKMAERTTSPSETEDTMTIQ